MIFLEDDANSCTDILFAVTECNKNVHSDSLLVEILN
jgi:hypothetical protein